MAKSCSILLIDDHAAIRETLTEVLTDCGHSVVCAENQTKALAHLAQRPFDLVLTDLMLPDGSGMEILAESKKLYPATPVVLVTGHGSIENAVEATRLGAYEYLTKPVDLNKLRVIVKNALHLAELERRVENISALDALVGQSPAIVEVKELIKQVAYSDVTVLIEGESGTGKELVANALQAQSPRAGAPFIKVNVAALSRDLVESELFGHERGAFSGAIRQRKGRFEMADNGTLFLDEIGEMPLDMQVKLLRVLQEHELERVGGSETIPVNIRLLCATNRDLRQMVEEHRFREDLFFRINVLRIKLPPLRERGPEDIEFLARHFLQKYNARYQMEKEFSEEFLLKLRRYSWPGNVRELENTLEGAFVRAAGKVMEVGLLPEEIRGASPVAVATGGAFPPGMTIDEVEKEYILSELKRCEGNKSKAAKSLNIGIKTLYRKLEAYDAL
ncbi:MAG: sigma-54-dependent Fis family transcriptional regulator [Planctomycetes bacterium]|nr:sigma-54-dependent Fis family transcriptional regulator [Planctomycetota bacterium]